MNQTKEKALATPASATSAENKYHIEDTTENGKLQDVKTVDFRNSLNELLHEAFIDGMRDKYPEAYTGVLPEQALREYKKLAGETR